jgi:integrase
MARTMSTIIGLLATTGMRIGEAIALDEPDFDPEGMTLTIRSAKFGKDRRLPLDPTSVECLEGYLNLLQRRAVQPDHVGPIFIMSKGTRPHRGTIESYFHHMTIAAGLRPQGNSRPRPHDLRHSFATRAMINAYQTGADPARTLTLLATWLGHTSPANTYWYLSAAPELMELAAKRLEPQPSPDQEAGPR